MDNRLKQILSPVFKLLSVPVKSLEACDSYVVTLKDGLMIELKESPDEFLTVSCLVPIPAERFSDPETLGILLQTNLLGLEHPPILTGAIVEQQKIILWTRQAFLMLDQAAMLQLFNRFTEQAQRMTGWLALPLKESEDVKLPSQAPQAKTSLNAGLRKVLT
ncbi:CesT family type III secretion system chaperone [Pseudomonas syringae]|uniref:CesT family type III secretion system chaperone n=1 Tax=Pseudomonas syringae TaxID=317 RepID=UPI00042486C3|nr:CesT family type III secretion system chaperone [Pseudomonas syringae]